jgi:hypothetical protein
MNKILTLLSVGLFVAVCCPKSALAEQAVVIGEGYITAPERLSEIPALSLKLVSFEDKEALLETINSLSNDYLKKFMLTILNSVFKEFNKTVSPCEMPDGDVIKCLNESIHKFYIPELFEAHRPDNYSNVYFKEQLEDSKTKEEFLKNVTAYGLEADKRSEILSGRYKAAFQAVSGVFAQAERSLPKRPDLTPEQEDALWEKLGPDFTEENMLSLTAAERDIYKKSIVLALIKTNVPEILDDLRPYMSILFGSVLQNNPQKERVARTAINSLIKINRRELDKNIKKALSEF